ncbi:tRNA (guanosine(18)-2'-O)-methyltransferase TARBP1-like isoform X2 [Clavelina lepadiformis]|uniref:tRNA (guanosine(18)-2'-O)-methyltransferase TARBP1-like isoform X2 n=1 Tax=Clavelina lepadiformis TaxID=159417 RepID=UPI004042A60A
MDEFSVFSILKLQPKEVENCIRNSLEDISSNDLACFSEVSAKKLSALTSLLSYNESCCKYSLTIIPELEKAFKNYLMLLLKGSSPTTPVLEKFIIQCASLQLSCKEISKQCIASISQLFSAIKSLTSTDDIYFYDKQIKYSKSQLIYLAELFINKGALEITYSILESVVDAICGNTVFNEDSKNVCILLEKALVRTAQHEINAEFIAKCLLMIKEYLIQLTQPAVVNLLLTYALDNQDEDFYTKEIETGIDVLFSVLAFAKSLTDILKDDNFKKISNQLLQILSHYTTWATLQIGIYHRTATTRKKTVHLIHLAYACVVSLESEIVVFWPSTTKKYVEKEDIDRLSLKETLFSYNMKTEKSFFTLNVNRICSLCESLEENQIHVIKPILDNSVSIFANAGDKENFWKISWLFAVFKRIFTHENKTVQKEGMLMLFSMEFAQYPMMKEKTFLPFLFSGVLKVVRDNIAHCIKSPIQATADGNSVLPALLLENFFKKCYDDLDGRKVALLRCILYSMWSGSWSPAALLYMCDVLYSFPVTSAWNSDDVYKLRFLASGIQAQNILKKYIMHLLLLSLLRHCDIKSVTSMEILKIVVVCSENHALIRGDNLWEKISLWYTENVLQMKNLYLNMSASNFAAYKQSWFRHLLMKEVDLSQTLETKCYAFGFMLIIDGLILNRDDSKASAVINAVMSPAIEIAHKAAMHAYILQQKIKCVFSFIDSVVTLYLESSSKQNCGPESLKTKMSQTCEGLLEYICHRLPVTCQDVTLGCLPLQTVKNFASLAKKDSLKYKEFFGKLHATMPILLKSTIHVRSQLQTMDKILRGSAAVSSALSLHWCCQVASQHAFLLDPVSSKLLKDNLSVLDVHGALLSSLSDEKERMLKIRFQELQWLCIPFCLKNGLFIHEEYNLETYIELLIEQLDIMPAYSLECLYIAAQALLSQVNSQELHVAGKCINALWKTTCDNISSSSFRKLYKHFVSAVFQANILSALFENPVSVALTELSNDIANRSKLKLGLLSDVILCWVSFSESGLSNSADRPCSGHNNNNEDVIDVKTNEEDLNSNPQNATLDDLLQIFAKQFELPIVPLCSPPLLSLYERIIFFVHCLIYLGPSTKDIVLTQTAVEHAQTMDEIIAPFSTIKEETLVNLAATAILLKLDISNMEHIVFGNHVLHSLIEEDEMGTVGKAQCHFGSHLHCTKQKIWQNILLLISFTPCNEVETTIQNFVSILDFNLPSSVRYYCEWSLTLLLFRFPNCESILIDKLQSHCTRKSLKGNSFNEFFFKLINIAIPWCTTQHFTVRLHGFAILQRVHDHFKDKGELDALLKVHPTISSCLEFANSSSGNVLKNWNKIKHHFMLFQLDPIADFSLESIFCSIPRLCNLNWVDLNSVKLHVAQESTWVPIADRRGVLGSLPSSTWYSSFHKEPFKFPVEPIGLAEDSNTTGILKEDANVQKKFVVSRDKVSSGLILVASLITKPSNLGGLTRSCEVFGAECLVVHSLSCMEDKLYQSLAVTAHKWMKMEEVKRWDLSSYLTGKRGQGYKLVGIEQTEKSKLLTEYRFPRKCVLVLGSEKEGIPHSLLSTLDECVEIPQMGMIRSLNVHVSGAVTVWEYRKQHIDDVSCGEK